MTYHQLTELERYMISKLRKSGQSVSEIAQLMDRHRSTIYREYQRNSTQVRSCLTYCPSKAQERRNGRLRRSRRGSHHSEEQYARVAVLLKEQWSPEQISGTLAAQGEFKISYQTIYRHIRRDWRAGGDLYLELRRRYKRRKRHYGVERRGRLQGKRMIDERPAIVDSRQEVRSLGRRHHDGSILGQALHRDAGGAFDGLHAYREARKPDDQGVEQEGA